jgi:hypothetical protein
MPKSKITTTFIIFLIMSTAILVLIVPIYTNPRNVIIDEINNGVKLSSDRRIKIKGGWNSFSENGVESNIVLTAFNILEPKYSLIYSNNKEFSYIQVIKVVRTSFFDFQVYDYTIVEARKSFSEAVALAQKYDLSKENPDPASITVFAPLQPSSGRQYVGSEGVTIPSQGSAESK